MKKILLIAFAATAVTSAHAVNIFWSGDTTGAPTFNRPANLTTLAGSFANAVVYNVQPFYVTVTGDYVFEANANHDVFILIYGAGWNPASPLTDLKNGDDDFGGTFTVLAGTGQGFNSSRIAVGESSNFAGVGGSALTANTQYYAVVTAFANVDFGTYDAGIGNGQGDVIAGAVPEPATMAVLGLGALVAAARRRRK